MLYLIYQTTNLLNNKIYIGKHQTNNLDDGYIGSGKHLNRAIKKYGLENFKTEILFKFDTEQEMNAKEAELVTEDFCSREDTYNICVGGQGGWSYVNKNIKRNPLPGYKAGLANYWLGKKRSPISLETRKKLSEANKGKSRKHTDETKNKIGLANSKLVGSKNPQYGKIWITDGKLSKMIPKTSLIPDGWYKGRICQ